LSRGCTGGVATTDEIVNPLLGRAGFVFVGTVFLPFAAAA